MGDGTPSPGGIYNETDTYDPVGNLTNKGGVAYAYTGSGHAHAPASVGGAAYTYDANGNVTQEAQAGRSYVWDGRNLPVSISTAPPPPVTGTPSLIAPSRSEPVVAGNVSLVAPSRSEPVLSGTPNLTAPGRGVGPQTSTSESYTYDADGQRVTRTAGGSTTLYIGGIFEQDMPSNLTRSQYAFAGHLIAQRASAGAVPMLYLHGDHLGSVSAVTNGTTGAVVDRQEYGPWRTIRSGGITETTRNYTGQKRDGTGLLYYHARYYDPALGRFLSPDGSGVSAGTPQTLNRYSYVGNNPLNYTDPTGHCRPDDCDPGENYSPPDPGGNGNGGDGGNGDNGGHDNEGGAAAFADLVQTIDQIPVGGDPAIAAIIANAEAQATGVHTLSIAGAVSTVAEFCSGNPAICGGAGAAGCAASQQCRDAIAALAGYSASHPINLNFSFSPSTTNTGTAPQNPSGSTVLYRAVGVNEFDYILKTEITASAQVGAGNISMGHMSKR